MTSDDSAARSFVVVSLDHVKRSVADIQAALESLQIPADVVESGRRLRWNSAVVLRIPEQRIPEVMLVLAMQGFTDVMAYQSGDPRYLGGGDAGGQRGQTTNQYTRRNEGC